jgi:hypothetical protein
VIAFQGPRNSRGRRGGRCEREGRPRFQEVHRRPKPSWSAGSTRPRSSSGMRTRTRSGCSRPRERLTAVAMTARHPRRQHRSIETMRSRVRLSDSFCGGSGAPHRGGRSGPGRPWSALRAQAVASRCAGRCPTTPAAAGEATIMPREATVAGRPKGSHLFLCSAGDEARRLFPEDRTDGVGWLASPAFPGRRTDADPGGRPGGPPDARGQPGPETRVFCSSTGTHAAGGRSTPSPRSPGGTAPPHCSRGRRTRREETDRVMKALV